MKHPLLIRTSNISWALSAVLCLCLAGCGGSSSSVSPSPSPTPAPAPAPQPAPTPAPPAFPSMTGGWGGTLAITSIIRSSGARSSNTCNQTWIVTTQTGGDFSGTYQLSGGTTSACSDAGTLSGSVATSGALSALRFVGQPQTGATVCTRISGDGSYSGVVSGAANLTAQSTDALRCTTTLAGVSASSDADRTLALAVTKR